jgi:hypothetical protein
MHLNVRLVNHVMFRVDFIPSIAISKKQLILEDIGARTVMTYLLNAVKLFSLLKTYQGLRRNVLTWWYTSSETKYPEPSATRTDVLLIRSKSSRGTIMFESIAY